MQSRPHYLLLVNQNFSRSPVIGGNGTVEVTTASKQQAELPLYAYVPEVRLLPPYFMVVCQQHKVWRIHEENSSPALLSGAFSSNMHLRAIKCNASNLNLC